MSDSRPLPSLPHDFQRALKRSRLHAFFLECAYVHRAGYLSWILTTVRPKARARRIQEAITRLRAQRTEVEAAARAPGLAEIYRPASIMASRPDRPDERRSA